MTPSPDSGWTYHDAWPDVGEAVAAILPRSDCEWFIERHLDLNEGYVVAYSRPREEQP